MRYRIVKIELRDDENVVIYLKKEGRVAPPPASFDPTDFSKMIDFGIQLGQLAVKSLEELMQFDAYITLTYEHYNQLDLKVGDSVVIEIKPAVD